MSQPVSKVPVKEVNNYPQGKSGAKVKIIKGPPVGGSVAGNGTKPLSNAKKGA